jgi:hypothetical protein
MTKATGMKMRSATTIPELIWQGRMQIGDEPGVYGDAQYSGLAAELPVTITPFQPGTTGDVIFRLGAEGASNFGPPYAGHVVTVFSILADAANPLLWVKKPVAFGNLIGPNVDIGVTVNSGGRYFSVRVEADAAVGPGFYDDFVWNSLSLIADKFYADFGFRSP